MHLNPTKRLNRDSVFNIIYEMSKGQTTGKELAAKYGVHPRTIYDIIHGKTWRYVQCPYRLAARLALGRFGRKQAEKGRKLPIDLKKEIKYKYDEGYTFKQLAKLYGLCASSIRLMVREESYR